MKSSFKFDFTDNEFVFVNGDCKRISGIDALKQWIEKILRTQLGAYAMYTGYGSNIRDLVIGSAYNRDFTDTELKREIEEALLKNDDILSVESIDISLFITTTNEFTKHESDVGLNNSGDTAENRRSQVIARLQGNNLLSRSELETLISNYEKSGCSIEEDFPNYTVYITFSGRKGIPENIDIIKAAVNEVKPAHLRFEYIYCENTWRDISEKFVMWGNISENVTWEMLMYHNRDFIYLDETDIPYERDETNAQISYNNGSFTARRI